MAIAMRQLCAVLDACEVRGDLDCRVTGVIVDSRQAEPGRVFVAVEGAQADGHDYLSAALKGGCSAAVIQAGAVPGLDDALLDRFEVLVLVSDSHSVPALFARTIAGNPDDHLFTAGVTGTNGKTTVASLLQCVLDQLHGPCGLLGTIRYQAGSLVESAPLTTPAGPELYAWLGRMVAADCQSVALELSSHALDQDRAAGLKLDVAVMTNLGRDHLDYHAGIEDYLAAKVRILELLRPGLGIAVINMDDPALAPLARNRNDCVGFSPSGHPVAGSDPDLLVTRCRLGLAGTALEIQWRNQSLSLTSPLVGRYNVENLAGALAALLGAGYPVAATISALENLDQVPGRMERFPLPNGALAVVDYAHTPDALAAVLGACRELTEARVLVMFGCGGDRDRGKRPLMGKVAAEMADGIWITADNPRSEDPAAINREIAQGVASVTSPRSASCLTIPDRTEAIALALAAARDHDVVVLAGKGHEDYQLVGDQVLALDDREVVRNWIATQGDNHD